MPDTTYELCLDGSERDVQDHLMDAIDAASDQDRTTWLTDATGRRIARIAPVDEIPGGCTCPLCRITEKIATSRIEQRLTEDGAAWRREELSRLLAGKRRETEPVWQAGRLDAIEARLNTLGQRVGSGSGDGLTGLVQAVARQVEEIHRTLGLERDEDGEMISDTPLLVEVMAGQVEVMYHGLGFCGDGFGEDDEDEYRWAPAGDFDPEVDEEVAARLNDGDLIVINRDMMIQVLAGDMGVTGTGQARQVWEALRDLARGRTQPEPEPDPALVPKLVPSHPITMPTLVDVLSLAGVFPGTGVLSTWTYSQRVDAYDWAVREHLNASDTGIARVPRPAFIPTRTTRATR
jgi:hypothetical protein